MYQNINTIQAIGWYISKGLFAALMYAIIRHLSNDLHIFVILFFSLTLTLPILFCWTKNRTKHWLPPTTRIKLYLVRVLLGFSSISLLTYCITQIPLASVTALNFTAPLFSVLLAIIFLREQLTSYRAIALTSGLIGMLIIIQPGTTTFHIASLLMIVSAFLYAIVNLIVKRLLETDSPSTTTIYTWSIMAIICLFPAIYTWRTPDIIQLGWLFLLSICSAGMILSTACAFNKADLVTLMPFDFMSLVFTIIIAFIVFDEQPEIAVIIGGVIILTSSVYNMFSETKK